MASFKYLIFFALTVYAASVAADEGARVKKHAYIAAAPAPVLAYSAKAPGSFSYGYSTVQYPSYAPYSYPAVSAYSAYPAVSAYSAYPAAAAYAAYPAAYPAGYTAYSKYAEDDGSYWPGKYEKTYVPAAYPSAYHY